MAAAASTAYAQQQQRNSCCILRAPVRDSNHEFSQRVWSWTELRTKNIVMQRRDYSCGAAALATIVKYHLGDNVDEDYFLDGLDKLLTPEQIQDRIKNGLSLADLRRVAVADGYEAVVTRLTFDQLAEAKVPLLVGIAEGKYKHFVVYRGTNYRWVYLADPIRGQVHLTPCEFVQQWQQHLALAVGKPGQDVPKTHALSLTDCDLYWGKNTDQLIRTLPQHSSVNQAIQR